MSLADLHCDLLCYLAGDNNRSALDLQARCALPQLKQAGISLQTLAIYCETAKGSAQKGMQQLAAFQQITRNHGDQVYALKRGSQIEKSRIGLTIAIENASSLCEEEEPIVRLFERLEHIEKHFAAVPYISMTWNEENRFGGGAHAPGALKPDGKRLLEFLNGRRTAIDLSHASDWLADDIINTIDRYSYQIPIIASHSNFRAVTPVVRNLPDQFVREIERRKGIVGLNFYRAFVGQESPMEFVRQLDYALKHFFPEILCLGADFFYDEDVPPDQRKRPDELYFPEACHAGIAYSYVMELWKKHLGLDPALQKGIAYNNLHRFLTTQIL